MINNYKIQTLIKLFFEMEEGCPEEQIDPVYAIYLGTQKSLDDNPLEDPLDDQSPSTFLGFKTPLDDDELEDPTNQIQSEFLGFSAPEWIGDIPRRETRFRSNKNTLYDEPGDPPEEIPEPPGGGGPPPGLEQFTPETSRSPLVGAVCMESSTLRALSTGINTSHAPDDIHWIRPELWAAATWDGIPYNVCGKTTSQICKFVFPNANTMRGLRELFYATTPFVDNVHPTIAEIDAWHVKVIQHFRNLIGASQPVSASKCLFARAQWNSERQFTRVWDTVDYPGTCLGSSNTHCGATFLPTCPDQAIYIGSGNCCVNTAGSEGIFTVNKDLPWSIKLTRVIAGILCSEGLGGHTGPFVGRQFVGLSFTCQGDSNIIRAKWNGGLSGVSCP